MTNFSWKFYRTLSFLISSLLLIALTNGFAQQNIATPESDVINVFKRISPFVVNVHNVQSFGSGFEAFNERKRTGSGFIWNKEGYVITNFHVIRNANKLLITFKGKNYQADMVGAELNKDIAVLKLRDQDNLSSLLPMSQIPLADSSKLEVGQTAIAIGNPFGLDHSLTRGVISALNRSVPGLNNVVMRGMIQTDASINPGNSGGPLLDSQGRLIGMNTLIVSRSGTSAGLGFAVPSNDIDRIVKKIIALGKVIQNGLGIVPLSDRLAGQLKLTGVVILKVLPNSISEKAGLQGLTRNEQGQLVLGDVISEIDNNPIRSVIDLYNSLEKKKPGETITLNYVRGGKPFQAKMEWPVIKNFN